METWEVMFRIQSGYPPRGGAKWLRDELKKVVSRALDRHRPFNGLGVRVTEVKVFLPELEEHLDKEAKNEAE